jgi:hypothetical protein
MLKLVMKEMKVDSDEVKRIVDLIKLFVVNREEMLSK